MIWGGPLSLFRRFLLCAALLLTSFLLLAGCGGGDGGGVGVDPAGNVLVTESNHFVLQPNVKELPDDDSVAVVSVSDDGTIVLSGEVPPLEPGDVIIKNEGDQQFVRKVATVTAEGGTVTITTEQPAMTDVFAEADIRQEAFAGPEFLRQLQPSMPGVTFGEPVQIQARSLRNREIAAWGLPIRFDQALMGENSRGSVTGDGNVTLRLSIYTEVVEEKVLFVVPYVKSIALIPKLSVDGRITVKGTGSGDFYGQYPLTPEFNYPIGALGPLTVNLAGQLKVTVDGYIQADGELVMDGNVTMEGGVRGNLGAWQSVGSGVTTSFGVTPPSFQANARLNVSLLQPSLNVNLLGFGKAYVDATMLRLETEANLQGSEYDVRVYRTFRVDVGGDLELGVQPFRFELHTRLPLIQGSREQVAQLGVPLPQGIPGTIAVVPFPAEWTARPGEEYIVPALTFVKQGLLVLPFWQRCGWSSNNPGAVQIVRDYGFFAHVRCVGSGQAELVARAPGGLEGISQATVLSGVSLSSVAIRRETTSARLAQKLQARGLSTERADLQAVPDTAVGVRTQTRLRAIGRYSDGSEADLSYAVQWNGASNVSVARNGFLDALEAGSAAVSITHPGSGKGATTELQVQTPTVTRFFVTPLFETTLHMQRNEIRQLQAPGFTDDGTLRYVTGRVLWLSGDPSIVTVDLGKVTALRGGSTWIAAYDPLSNWLAVKTVEVEKSMTGIEIRPGDLTRVRPGTTQQFQAFAEYDDGTEEDISSLVQWYLSSSDVGTISPTGLATFTGQGRAWVAAFYNRRTAFGPQFDCRGPARFQILGQPPQSLTPGQPFELEIGLLDGFDQAFLDPVNVTVELSAGPDNANLAGILTRASVDGVVRFPGLTVDQVGTGYRIRVFAPGMTVAETTDFEATAGAPGHLITNDRNTDGPGGIRVVTLGNDGALSATAGSPYDATGHPATFVKVGNYLMVGIAGPPGPTSNSLDRFSYDPVTGALQFLGNSGADYLGFTPSQPLTMETNGSDTFFVLASLDRLLFTYTVDPATGHVEGAGSLDPGFGDIINSPNGMTFHDVPGSTTDYLFVADERNNAVHVLSYDAVTHILDPVPGSPFANSLPSGPGSGGGPRHLEIVGDHLYAVNPNGDALTSWAFDPATGALTAVAGSTATGTLPVALHAVGEFLYVGNMTGSVSAYQVAADGSLTALNGGVPYPAGEINPHSFVDVFLTPTQRALYVATSTRVAAFMVGADGLLDALDGSPFPGFGSPGDLRH